MYLHELYITQWNSLQAPTQYQGSGSSHELAALLVTEVIQHSKAQKLPLFLLFLDARSAFDTVVTEYLVRYLYLSGVEGDALLFLNHRLKHRKTYVDWDKTLMGPMLDENGVEQGGINSSDFYKLYNNDQLTSAQASCLGVDMGNSVVVGAIGQADDVILASNDIDSLRLLVTLTEKYCAKFRVKLVPSKTKLLAYSTESQRHVVEHAELINQISIGGEPVKFVTEAEHVGVIRNIDGNLPNIMHRITAHKRSMGAVLSAGLARGQRGNPAASLKVHQLYGSPVLFSGLATLVLSPAEVKIIDHHYQHTVQNVQRLHDKTPRSLVLLMAGSLPGEAILNLKQLTLFLMICHLPEDPLNTHARSVLISASSTARSWFLQIRQLCLMYHLDHPLHLLHNPPAKTVFKRLAKQAVCDYWENTLKEEASNLPSLHLFVASNCSLQSTHPIWTAAGSNSYECHKSTVLARMVSGRYRTDYLARHWTSNKNGFCILNTCHEVVGDLKHMLILCPGLSQVRTRMRQMFLSRQAAEDFPAQAELFPD